MASSSLFLFWGGVTNLTDSDLDVVPRGGVLEVVDGAQHVQGHVADVVGVESGLVGDACHHHVGVTNCLHLHRHRDKGPKSFSTPGWPNAVAPLGFDPRPPEDQ